MGTLEIIGSTMSLETERSLSQTLSLSLSRTHTCALFVSLCPLSLSLSLFIFACLETRFLGAFLPLSLTHTHTGHLLLVFRVSISLTCFLPLFPFPLSLSLWRNMCVLSVLRVHVVHLVSWALQSFCLSFLSLSLLRLSRRAPLSFVLLLSLHSPPSRVLLSVSLLLSFLSLSRTHASPA